jgi:hypothetical protein
LYRLVSVQWLRRMASITKTAQAPQLSLARRVAAANNIGQAQAQVKMDRLALGSLQSFIGGSVDRSFAAGIFGLAIQAQTGGGILGGGGGGQDIRQLAIAAYGGKFSG